MTMRWSWGCFACCKTAANCHFCAVQHDTSTTCFDHAATPKLHHSEVVHPYIPHQPSHARDSPDMVPLQGTGAICSLQRRSLASRVLSAQPGCPTPRTRIGQSFVRWSNGRAPASANECQVRAARRKAGRAARPAGENALSRGCGRARCAHPADWRRSPGGRQVKARWQAVGSGRGPFPAVGGLTARAADQSRAASQPPSFHPAAALASALAVALAGSGQRASRAWVGLSLYRAVGAPVPLAPHCRYSAPHRSHRSTRRSAPGSSRVPSTSRAQHTRSASSPSRPDLDPATRRFLHQRPTATDQR
ncbi:hypothetical protein SVAN01_10331 [Stagonosporopsis vannaccii]|nr:hypothetical protein SVAN01_10331 [Stagonosporopsis vannaccii]